MVVYAVYERVGSLFKKNGSKRYQKWVPRLVTIARAVASGVKGGDNSRGPHKIQEFYYIGPCSVNNSNILLVV